MTMPPRHWGGVEGKENLLAVQWSVAEIHTISQSTQSAKCVYVKRLPGVAEWTTLLAVLLLRTPRLTCVAQITDQMMLWDLTSSDVRLTYYEQDESATTPSEG